MSTSGQWARWTAGTLLLAVAAAWLMRPGDMPEPGGLLPGGTNLFGSAGLRQLALELTPAAMASLRQNPRLDVPVQITEGGRIYSGVTAHLKGSKGSFRPLDDKPGWTLDFPAPGFYGHTKIHLNNSVEDASYLHEWLGSEVFLAAGLPAARTTHAWVTLNGQTLGLYVLKEGFTEEFARRQFGSARGNFYEPKDGTDLGGEGGFERKWGTLSNAQAGLTELAGAIAEPDLDRRWERLGRCLNREEFAAFLAVEVMLGHRDGYAMARNNYRLFYHAEQGIMHFIPHGMDVLLGKADLTLQPHMSGLAAKSFMEIPAGRQLYRQQFERHFTKLLARTDLILKVAAESERLARQLPPAEARALRREADGLCQRIAQRREDLRRQLAEPEKPLLVFANNMAALPPEWRAVDPPPAGSMKVASAPDGRTALQIRAGPKTAASWRQRVRLNPGTYRFEGRICWRSVKALEFGRNRGAGLGVSGVESPPHQQVGDSDWQPAVVTFTVAPPGREVELRCELFAGGGEAWFDLESLRVVKLK